MKDKHKQEVMNKLKALTEGDTPLLHVVSEVGELICVHIQPWGPPIYLNYTQAEVFARDLPLEMPRAKLQLRQGVYHPILSRKFASHAHPKRKPVVKARTQKTARRKKHKRAA